MRTDSVYRSIKSYLDICKDNRYEFKPQFILIQSSMNNICILFRTCVDETKLCKGKPLCGNKNDLKWCKAVWKLPSPNFTNIMNKGSDEIHSKCTKGHQPDNFVPNGQDILSKDIEDGLFYDCFNRADENPFKRAAYNQSESKSWSELVRTPCPLDGDGKYLYRRCLGKNPNQCVATDGG